MGDYGDGTVFKEHGRWVAQLLHPASASSHNAKKNTRNALAFVAW